MKKSKLLLAALAVVLILTASIGSTAAYFTAHTEASGQLKIHLENQTHIHEDVSGNIKTITITNDDKSAPVFVRAKAIYSAPLTVTPSGDGWSPSDGWMYYTSAVPGGESAADLEFEISNPPEDAVVGDTFKVVIVFESVPALYKDGAFDMAYSWEVGTATVTVISK